MICASSVCAWLVAATFVSPPPQDPVPRNTRLARVQTPSYMSVPGPGSAFLVPESAQGSTDLNGDGDAVDSVLHVLLQGGALLDVGLAGDQHGPLLAGGTVALGVLESAQGAQDLNGDGDALDSVLHLVDSSSGAVVNTGLAGFHVQLSPSFAALAVQEADQGGQDLNGDGDALDKVLHHVATAGGATTNVGLAVQLLDIDDELIVAYVDEKSQGQDLDGDGGLDDYVPHVVDALQGSVLPLPDAKLDGGLNGLAVVSAGHVAYRLPEQTAGSDLNGDGDLADLVVQVVDVAAGTVGNTGLANVNSLAIDGPYLAVVVSESTQGQQDLNGDGDPNDLVAHLVHLPTAAIANTALAIGGGSGSPGRLFSFHVFENAQGNEDLNGDGDTHDYVEHVVRLDSGLETNVGLECLHSVTGARLVGIQVREDFQGAQDLNGDGDAVDFVWHAYDAGLGTTTNLGLATQGYEFDGAVGEDFLLFTANERDSGVQDLNGDGDAKDQVLHLLRAGFPPQNLGVAVYESAWLSGRRAVFAVHEGAQGNTDLNGDGDALDSVAFVLDVP